MAMNLWPQRLACPYCGETMDVWLDPSAGDQCYIEDCQICCRPIVMTVNVGELGELHLVARAEHEA